MLAVNWLIAGLVFSLFPIWRSGVHSRKEGRNLWEYVADISQKGYEPFGHPHIPYEEAVVRANEAYCECYRIGRRGQ